MPFHAIFFNFDDLIVVRTTIAANTKKNTIGFPLNTKKVPLFRAELSFFLRRPDVCFIVC